MQNDRTEDALTDPDAPTSEDVWSDVIAVLLGYLVAPGLLLGFVIYVLWKL